MSKFGDRLRELRRQRGLTQKTVANALNISQGNYWGYESGRSEPGAKMLLKIGLFFQQDFNTLIQMFDESCSIELSPKEIMLENAIRMRRAADRIDEILDELEDIEKN